MIKIDVISQIHFIIFGTYYSMNFTLQNNQHILDEYMN